MTRAPKALAYAAFGARGTGKTAWVVQLLLQLRPARLAVWDFKHDPALRNTGQAVTDLAALIRAMAAPQFQLRYLVDHDQDIHAQFQLFCLACWAAGNLVMFVDELPEVTKANKAPPAWRKCVNVGRDYVDQGKRKSLTIIGAGQRPAECDKSFIANCDVVHTGRLGHLGDAKQMAAAWGCKPEDLTTLPDLAWIEKRAHQAGLSRGVLTFRNGPPAAVKKKPAGKSAPLRTPR